MSTFPSEDPTLGIPTFHRTAAGDLPLDWTVQALGAHVRITSGESPSKFRFEGSGTPFFKVDQLNGDSKYLATTPYFFAGPESVPAGSVVFPKRGASILLNKIRIFAADSYMDTNLMALTPISRIDSEFLYYTLEHIQLWRFADTASIPQINNKHVKPLPIPIPGEEEQRAIAGVLANVDSFLKKTDALLVKKRDLKQAAMQQLLTGTTRLAGFHAAWKTQAVAEMGDVLAGKALNAQGAGTPRPYLRTKNVLDGRIEVEDVLHMPMTEAEFERFRVKKGDVLLNEGQALELVGRCSLYRGELNRPCAMQNQLLRFRAGTNTCAEFAEQLFRHCQKTGIFAAIATQTTSVAHLGSVRFATLRLRWPTDVAEQTAIASVLSDMDSEVAALEAKRAKTLAIKHAVMQKLLTGKIRLV